MTIQRFTPEYLESLVDQASQSARGRQHRNIHTSYEDPSQRFMNAIGMDSYIRPHRHALDPKTETLVAVRGLFALISFDDEGTVQEIIRFGTERYSESCGLSVGVDLPPGTWHTILALKPESVLLELKAGPFDPQAAKEPAPWAPEEQSAEGLAFLRSLHSIVGNEGGGLAES